jgi:hypothetical protein
MINVWQHIRAGYVPFLRVPRGPCGTVRAYRIGGIFETPKANFNTAHSVYTSNAAAISPGKNSASFVRPTFCLCLFRENYDASVFCEVISASKTLIEQPERGDIMPDPYCLKTLRCIKSAITDKIRC